MSSDTDSGEAPDRGESKKSFRCLDRGDFEPSDSSRIIMTPVAAGMSQRDYTEQKHRISIGEQHCWDDSPNNTAKIGDLFAYVTNKCNGDSIELYEIEGISRPDERLASWSTNVGQGNRNVLLLGGKAVYLGGWGQFKKVCGYADSYNCQGTMRMGIEISSRFMSKMRGAPSGNMLVS